MSHTQTFLEDAKMNEDTQASLLRDARNFNVLVYTMNLSKRDIVTYLITFFVPVCLASQINVTHGHSLEKVWLKMRVF